ncbi:peptide-N(4)-(N-acetyl-beta-glucosaminyl)asparagine amidase-like [Porites lutea]|uniref:peptide-N(4)-(N-acetyl-beta- glucosaminyl)asparagine amidase-like n=1 Tax=Porites lutea TaxID=51062 RepID=UPI003CC5F2AE
MATAFGLLDYYGQQNEREFFARLQSLDEGVHLYEDPHLQEEALSHVPVQELKERAREACEKSKECGQDGVDEKDCFLLEVLAWFGTFFHWVDKPICADCGTMTESNGGAHPTEEERQWLAGRVELYKCPNCGKDERFPRYNHPRKLLETRHGRCGEIANFKALMLQSLGFEVRHVTDWTDHVWVEVYSESQQRWIICDGGKCDDFLLYEQGWGKKLTYIVAFSKDEVVDVTWKYSVNHDEVTQRRLMVREEWLSRAIGLFNQQRQLNLPMERRIALRERFVRELVEFFSNHKGKLFGTAAWRHMIGKPESLHEPYIFVPTDEEINNKRLTLSYCCASDKYFRGSKKETFLEGWKSGAAEVISVFRKYEYDWTTVLSYLLERGVQEGDLTFLQTGNAYLARLQGSPSGMIAWKVDLTSSDLVIDTVTITAKVTTTETGRVDWKLVGDDEDTQSLDFSNDQKLLTTSSLSDSKTLKLTAKLSGGRGDVAWKQAQLFSQPIRSENDFTFDITITLRIP